MSSASRYIEASSPQIIDQEFASPTPRTTEFEDFNNLSLNVRMAAAMDLPEFREHTKRYLSMDPQDPDFKNARLQYLDFLKACDTALLPLPTSNFQYMETRSQQKNAPRPIRPDYTITKEEALEFARIREKNREEEKKFKEESSRKLLEATSDGI